MKRPFGSVAISTSIRTDAGWKAVVIGRKLDFLMQEMNREANTIGSKGNDVEQARHVVDIKSQLEKIREQIQNIE